MINAYKSEWQGNTKNRTGFAIFNCETDTIKFKMNSFGDYLALCQIINKACNKTEHCTKVTIAKRLEDALEGRN